MKMWIFNWSQEHWESQFSLKNTLYVSIHDFNITDSHYNAPFAFPSRSNAPYFTHTWYVKFDGYPIWRYFFNLYWFSTGMEILDKAVIYRFFYLTCFLRNTLHKIKNLYRLHSTSHLWVKWKTSFINEDTKGV